MLPDYCKGARGAIFMYDVTNPSTLLSLSKWLKILQFQEDLPIMIVGTKIDLVEQVKVEFAELEQTAREYGLCGMAEVSAKTGVNVGEVFEFVATTILNLARKEERELETVVT